MNPAVPKTSDHGPVVKRVEMKDPLYQSERRLRNDVLLRPIGVPDFGWEMFDDRCDHFVALENHSVVGCALLFRESPDARTGRLMQMAVDTDLQSRGIGRLLVLKLLEFAEAEELSEVTCHARQAVVKFYERLGFVAYGEPFEEVGIPHRHMRIELGKKNR